MSNEAETLIEQARALSPQDRIALVEDVLDSLDRADPDIDQLWAREASERLAAYRHGELAAKDLGDIAPPTLLARADEVIEWTMEPSAKEVQT